MIISDDFSSNTISNDARLRVNSGPNWVKSSTSDWSVDGINDEATNPGTGTESQGALLRVFDVGAAALPDYNELTFTFDYTVGTGSTLYFHANGLFDGTLVGSTQLHNTGTSNGSIQSQYDNGGTGGDYTGINLKDGAANPNGAAGGAFELTGTGTFSQTINLTAAGYEEIGDLNDLQYVTMGWSSNVTVADGSGAITLDNFVFSAEATAVPEPSSFALLGGALACFAASRWRRRAKAAA